MKKIETMTADEKAAAYERRVQRNREVNAKWRRENVERDRARKQSYYAEHRDEIIERAAQRYSQDPEFRAYKTAAAMKWRRENPEKWAAIVARSRARAKAKKQAQS